MRKQSLHSKKILMFKKSTKEKLFKSFYDLPLRKLIYSYNYSYLLIRKIIFIEYKIRDPQRRLR